MGVLLEGVVPCCSRVRLYKIEDVFCVCFFGPCEYGAGCVLSNSGCGFESVASCTSQSFCKRSFLTDKIKLVE